MWCPRCKSSRIQRGYNNTLILLRLAGLHELLCNNCGLEFKGLDPLGKIGQGSFKAAGIGCQPAARTEVQSAPAGNHLFG